jgi:hypothetical protein
MRPKKSVLWWKTSFSAWTGAGVGESAKSCAWFVSSGYTLSSTLQSAEDGDGEDETRSSQCAPTKPPWKVNASLCGTTAAEKMTVMDCGRPYMR